MFGLELTVKRAEKVQDLVKSAKEPDNIYYKNIKILIAYYMILNFLLLILDILIQLLKIKL